MGPLSIYSRFFATYFASLSHYHDRYICVRYFLNKPLFSVFYLRFRQSYLSFFFVFEQPWLNEKNIYRPRHIEHLIRRPFYISRQNQTFCFATLCAEGVKKPSIFAQHRVFRDSVCVYAAVLPLFSLFYAISVFSFFFSLVSPFLSVKCSLTDTNCVRYQSRPSQLQNQCTFSTALRACLTHAAQLPAQKLPVLD